MNHFKHTFNTWYETVLFFSLDFWFVVYDYISFYDYINWVYFDPEYPLFSSCFEVKLCMSLLTVWFKKLYEILKADMRAKLQCVK